MKVGDLVKYSSEWMYEEGYCEEEFDKRAGVGIVLEEDTDGAAMIGESKAVLRHGWSKVYLIKWNRGMYDTWERAHSLEVLSESR